MKLDDMDIDDVVKAIIADEPELESHADSLRQSLLEMKEGRFARTTVVQVSPVAQTRYKVGLSQSKFAQRLGISVSTLKSWEQGQRKPSGAALKLIQLLDRYPNLVLDL